MRVRILFFGVLKDLMGRDSESLDLPDGGSVHDLLEHYVSRMPHLRESFSSLAVAVNQQYSRPDTRLKSDDEVALLPPVSGGSVANGPLDPAASCLRHAAITRDPIDGSGILARLKQGEDGAAIVFEGVVRNQTRGRKTLFLDYEAYEGMALAQLQALAEQATKEFKIRDVAVVHRLGRLQIGETSVLIVVAAAHRAAAFDACRWLIDTLKRTVPIWKKEYFEDGAVWADGEPFPGEIPRASGSPPAKDASK